ncbi:YolD-like family protein [Paenibacillus daejeonensis]|uniref:YolD-like family protein n=1 Tax=Paenibacillus daejeonensis TaxID=135193 RepID=UPI001FE00BB7|nr:YolD-like family protein [Paenibacillus daejeonensis]
MVEKLEGNGLWESSRMILPEHRTRHKEQRRLLQRRDRINLDEQELEQMQECLAESLEHRTARIPSVREADSDRLCRPRPRAAAAYTH